MHLNESDFNPGERDCRRAQSPGRREKSLFNFMLRVVLMICATTDRGEKITRKANKLNSLVVRLQQIKQDLIRTDFHLYQKITDDWSKQKWIIIGNANEFISDSAKVSQKTKFNSIRCKIYASKLDRCLHILNANFPLLMLVWFHRFHVRQICILFAIEKKCWIFNWIFTSLWLIVHWIGKRQTLCWLLD